MWALLLTIVSTIVCAKAAVNSTMTGDMYVFAQSWTPEFCYGESTWPGCTNHRAYWGDHFTIHGLWPQYSTGGYPATCTTEAFDTTVPKQIGWNDMTNYWPDVQYALTDPEYDSFWEHEWTKHGTCSGLSQVDYFQTTINLLKSFGTPQSVITAADSKTTISASSLRSAYGGAAYVALQCESGKYLSGAYTCWSASSGLPKSQIQCPSDVQSEDTCTSETLTVQTW